MHTLAIKYDLAAVDANIDTTMLHITLADGRELAVPLEWFPRLRDATPGARVSIGDSLATEGEGIR